MDLGREVTAEALRLNRIPKGECRETHHMQNQRTLPTVDGGDREGEWDAIKK